MTQFYIERWVGYLERATVDVNPAEVKDWGNPMETAYAVLAWARWGRGTVMPMDFRRRTDTVTKAGDEGEWEGTAGGHVFSFKNLAIANLTIAKGTIQPTSSLGEA